jgi:hypothetical protein
LNNRFNLAHEMERTQSECREAHPWLNVFSFAGKPEESGFGVAIGLQSIAAAAPLALNPSGLCNVGLQSC